jgi:hypothetical protein
LVEYNQLRKNALAYFECAFSGEERKFYHVDISSNCIRSVKSKIRYFGKRICRRHTKPSPRIGSAVLLKHTFSEKNQFGEDTVKPSPCIGKALILKFTLWQMDLQMTHKAFTKNWFSGHTEMYSF